MKRIALIISFVAFIATAWGQINPKDSTINIIAHFDKDDKVEYVCTEAIFKIIGNDTIFDLFMTARIELRVIEATQNGYKVAYTPLEYSYGENEHELTFSEAGKQGQQLGKNLEPYLDHIKPIFELNKYGQITHIANFKEIQKQENEANKKIKKDLKINSKLKTKTEKDILEQYDEMELLFRFHGLQATMKEITENTDGITRYACVKEEKPTTEHDTDGDYVIKTETHIKNLSDYKDVAKREHIRYWADGWTKHALEATSIEEKNGTINYVIKTVDWVLFTK